ncbi:MAG: DegT/DnrJ/EryC1/StrS family aminotransferase [Candidatus Sungbacteria bacterium]|nr:DegT/DnrJ/EryC1/StrS family aminotransferase [Candidatus Sungbacteria bacterium]
MTKVPFVDLKWQHNVIKNSLAKRWEKIFAKTAFIGGEDCDIFEKNFAKFLGVKYAVSVGSGTDSLTLALRSLGIGKEDEVITVPTTYYATASAIVYVGAKPIFVDIDPETRDFDYKKLQKSITRRTKAIIPVHLYGQPMRIDKVMRLAREHKLKVIEDACQAHGAKFRGKRVGTFGDLGCFSFYPGKNLGGYGDGGMVVTNDKNLDHHLRELRNFGGIAKYEHNILGYNSRLDTLQATVLDEKLKYLDSWNRKRNKIAQIYHKELKGLRDVKIFETLPYTEAVYHLYVIELEKGSRDDLMKYLKERGVATVIHYPNPLHLLPPFQKFGYKKGAFPVAEKYCRNILSLPMFPGMTRNQALYVSKAIREYFAHK